MMIGFFSGIAFMLLVACLLDSSEEQYQQEIREEFKDEIREQMIQRAENDEE